MLKNAFSMSLLFFVILYSILPDIECCHTIVFTVGTVFQSFQKNLIISKIAAFFILDGCLQPFV